MKDASMRSSGIIDKNGNVINSGDVIKYLEKIYIVMDIGKEEIDWVGYPCGSNLSTETIKLQEISQQVEIIKL